MVPNHFLDISTFRPLGFLFSANQKIRAFVADFISINS